MAQELVFRLSVTGEAAAKAAIAGVRAEVAAAGQGQKTVQTGDLSMRQQLAAVTSLQRQRSAALVSQWKQEQNVVTGLRAHIARLTDTMQALGSSSAVLQGPLGGVAGRLRSVGALATEAGGGLGIAAAGGAALIVVAAGLAVGLFKLTEATAEFQGKLFDLSQQTGVSVETLSTLDAMARTTGGDINAISQSLGLVQGKMEDAQDPTSKAAEAFKTLGVEVTTTEETFRAVLAALSKMPEGFQQTAAARDLFGGRGAKALLAILKETNGDLDGTTERLRAMGALITGPMAQAADKFNDDLELTKLQIRGLAAIIGNEAMPVIGDGIKEASRLITDNRKIIVGWTHDVGDAAKGAAWLAGKIWEISNQVTGLSNLPVPLILRLLAAADPTGLVNIEKGLQSLGTPTDIPALPGNDALTPVPLRPSNAPSGTKTKATKGKTARDTTLQDSLRDAVLTEREILQLIEDNTTENKRALDEQVRDIEEFTARAIALANERYNAVVDRTNAELEATQIALNKKLIKQAEFDRKWRETGIEVEDARQENVKEIFELESERDKKKADAQIAAKRRELEIAEDADQGTIDRTKDRVDRMVMLESEGEREIGTIIDGGFARRRKALEEEETAYGLTLQRRADITAELIRLDGDRARAAEEAAQRIVDAQAKEMEPPDANRILEGGMPNLDRVLMPPPEASAAWVILKDAAMDALGSMAQGVGGLIQQWVLYGSIGPGAIKKMLAAVLAAAAAQAAVEAIMQLAHAAKEYALGVAAASNPFTAIQAPGHFLAASAHLTAAGIYGAVAGVAAGAGRIAAGNAFNESTGGRASGSGSGGGGGTSGTPREVVVDRRQGLQTQTITTELLFKVKGDVVVDEFVKDYDLNGRVRIKIQSDGQG